MTIAIDASSAAKGEKTGIERYAFELIQAMKREPLQPGEQVVLYSLSPLPEPLSQLPAGWSSKVLNWSFNRGWMQGRVSLEMLRHAPDVLFVPGQSLPMFLPKKSVTTIHDLGFHEVKDAYTSKQRNEQGKATRRAVRRATKIIAPSTFTADELVRIYHAKPNQLAVTPLAADPAVFHRVDEPAIAEVRARHRLGRNYFLYVGRVETKKNIVNLIRAFDIFKSTRGIGDPFELVLAGKPGVGYQTIRPFIDLSVNKQAIRELGYISDTDAAALMSGAMVVTFVSQYEGFGFPILEAALCGTPVIASDIPPFRELMGSAGAVFVDPINADAIARIMTDLVHNPPMREALVMEAGKRALLYSWQETARRTFAVLRR